MGRFEAPGFRHLAAGVRSQVPGPELPTRYHPPKSAPKRQHEKFTPGVRAAGRCRYLNERLRQALEEGSQTKGHNALRVFWTNDPGMSMKTKDRQFRSPEVEELRKGPFEDRWPEPSGNRTCLLLDYSTLNSSTEKTNERSGNVYVNKGPPVQKSRSRGVEKRSFRGPTAGAERQPNLFTPRLLDS